MTTFRILSATVTDVVSLGDGREHVREVLGEFRTFRRTPVGEELDALQASLGEQGVELAPDHTGATIPSMQVGLYAPGGTVEGVGLGSD